MPTDTQKVVQLYTDEQRIRMALDRARERQMQALLDSIREISSAGESMVFDWTNEELGAF